MKKRGQLAVETLLIYGITFLIVLLAIGALIAFGVLDVGSLLPDRCTIRGTPLECSETLLSKSLGFGLAIDNNFGQTLGSLRLVNLEAADSNDAGLISCSNLPADFVTSAGSQVGDGTVCAQGWAPCSVGNTNRCWPQADINPLWVTAENDICTGNTAAYYSPPAPSNYYGADWTLCYNSPDTSSCWLGGNTCSWSKDDTMVDPGTIVPDGSTDWAIFMCDGNELVQPFPAPLVAGERAQILLPDCVPSQSLKAGRKVNLEFTIEYTPAGTAFQGARTTTGSMTLSVVD